MQNVDQIAKLLSRNGHVHPAFRAAVSDALMEIVERIAQEWGRSLADTIEAIATTIVVEDADFVFPFPPDGWEG